MRRLAPDFFNRRYDDLVETGRSRLPSLAPRWTDYNAHDPGITLMELLAWTGEAQLYSLARMRRDERAAYAALLGLRVQGPTPARGMLWPDRSDRDSPFLSFQRSLVLEQDAPLRTTSSDNPRFHLAHRILWTPGRVAALRSLPAEGQPVDLTRANEHGDREFEPFGALAGPRDLLCLSFAANGDQGLFPSQRVLADDALWPIGVRVAPPVASGVADTSAAALPAARIEVAMRFAGERIELPVVDDGTRGFMRSGVLLLDVSSVPGSPTAFTLEISAPRGFPRPPRIVRIEPGVLPIVEGGMVAREAHAGQGMPGQQVRLMVPGLRFGEGAPSVTIEVVENGMRRKWRQVDDLAGSGPEDTDYELDAEHETIRFGNGVNGYPPPFESQVLASYPFCAGSAANTAPGQRWMVGGIAGIFGANPDAIGGGTDARQDRDLRREARSRLRGAHPLVTAEDLQNAALALAELEVARAWVPAMPACADALPEIVLVAMRKRTASDEPAEAPEMARWLAALRRALLPRMPIGAVLRVRAPAYRTFSVIARIETLPRRDPAEVEAAVRASLRDAFTLVPRPGLQPRKFGVPVTSRDVAARIRAVPGVQRIAELTIQVDGKATTSVTVGKIGLARLDLGATSITAARGAPGDGR